VRSRARLARLTGRRDPRLAPPPLGGRGRRARLPPAPPSPAPAGRALEAAHQTIAPVAAIAQTESRTLSVIATIASNVGTTPAYDRISLFGVAAPAVPPAAVQATSRPRPGQFLHVDTGSRTATITLIAGYDSANGGFNFDGYGRGELLVTVPKGWRVVVQCHNRSIVRHSCAVVGGPLATSLAFPGATTPHPRIGLEQGQTSTFSFRASRVGVFRLACLVPGHEEARMWDVLRIVPHGRPSIVARAGP
jgi:Sulfocyanin (SoxE) domain